MFQPVAYGDLNSRQKENYNFQKVAARMADFGFNCLRLTDDWQGADFIACHIDGETFPESADQGADGHRPEVLWAKASTSPFSWTGTATSTITTPSCAMSKSVA